MRFDSLTSLALHIQVGGMPCAPCLVVQLGALSSAAKALRIRKMLARGFLFSSQLFVMWPHTEAQVKSLASVLNEVLAELSRAHESRRLPAEAGVSQASAGFARLI